MHFDSYLAAHTEEGYARFNEARGGAIQSYANYEAALARLFSLLLMSPPELTGHVFFRINNARARLEMLDVLLRSRFPEKYDEFWDSLKKLMQPLDHERNRIVHWSALARDVTAQHGQQFILRPPNFHQITDKAISETTMRLFTHKCGLILNSIFGFAAFLEGGTLLAAPISAWAKICSERIVYPPPPEHLLFQPFPGS